MRALGSRQLRSRVEDRVRAWRVVVERGWQTETSFIALGRRDGQPVALKVLKKPGDEWRCGEILAAFEGRGVVRVYESFKGAVLLERPMPGESLASLALAGRDAQATEILAGVIGTMSPQPPAPWIPTAREWGGAFERYAASRDRRIPRPLVEHGHRVYSALCGSQARPRLLHGDLHHHNVLLDSERGWLAVDPKGVVAELEYEVGAALRNPYEEPELFGDRASIERRVECFATRLSLDADRTVAWSFAQAVRAAVWAIEDGLAVEPGNPWLEFARVTAPMLRAWG